MCVYEKPRIILYIIKIMVSTFQNRFCQYFCAQMSLKYVENFVLPKAYSF